MKGAVAVMIELALAKPPAGVDLGYVFFGREELPVVHSALSPLLAREPGLRAADAVIVMEPTATEEQIQKVIESLVEVGYDVHRSTGVSHTVLGAVGAPRVVVDPTAL